MIQHKQSIFTELLSDPQLQSQDVGDTEMNTKSKSKMCNRNDVQNVSHTFSLQAVNDINFRLLADVILT